jgi:twitching motility protein PilT
VKLLDSLLDAIVRLDGDALVMHVGEKPYVVTTSATMNEYRGPLAWGQVELSSRVLTTDAVLGMLGQILSLEQRQALEEYGAIEHEIAAAPGSPHRFTVVAARGGDDVWLEVRRRSLVAPPAAEAAGDEAAAEAVAHESLAEVLADADTEVPPLEVIHDEVQRAPTDADVDAMLAASGGTESPALEAVASAERIEPEPIERIERETVKRIELEPATERAVAIQQESEPVAPPPVAVESDPIPVREPASVVEPEAMPVREPVAAAEPEPVAHVAPLPDVAVEREPEPVVEPAPAPAVYVVREPEAVVEHVPATPTAIEAEPEPVAHAATAPPVALEREPELVVEPAPQPAVSLIREPEPVEERVPATPASIEAEPEPIARPAPTPAVAIEPEPEPVVERIAASAVTLEPEPAPVHDAPIEPVVRVLEPEPVPAPSLGAPPETVQPEEEPVAEPVAAIELEPPAVHEPAAAIRRVVIESEPEPVRDVVVGFRPDPRPIVDTSPSIEPVPDPIVVAGRAKPSVIAVEPEPVRVEQAPVTIEGDSIVRPAAAIEPEIPPVTEPAPIVASGLELVADRRIDVQPELQPVQEPVAAGAQEAVLSAAEPIAREPFIASSPELTAILPPGRAADAPRHAAPAASTPTPAAPPEGNAPPAIETEQIVEQEPVVAAKTDDALDQRPAIVLPLSRYAIKPDQPAAEARPAAALPLDRVLRIAAARGAATVYVIAQSAPMIRVDGEISALDGETAWTSADIDRLVMDLAPARVRDGGQASGEWVTDVPDVGRVRCVTFRDHRGPGVIFGMIPPRAISAEQLGLSAEIQALCSQSDGLVLVTGARASGKSTLLSAFVDVVNRTRSDHVITIEPQIGFVHESRRSFVSQREVRGDSEQITSAVRSAFREDPDVLMIEDLRTYEVVALALEAAESGRLVFGSIPAPSTVAAIDRVIELFPAERRAQAQTSLAGSLRGVISQVLLRKTRGGRVAAREVLLNTPSVAGLIMEGKTFQLPVALDSGRRQGMTPLADSLAALIRDGTVQAAEAYRKAQDREALLTILRREGVDTSFVERLA